MNSFLKKLLLGLAVIIIAVMLFLYFGTYSSGTRAGVIMKISNSGVIFKTWEGQLDMGTFGAVKSDNFASQTFEFSIDGSDAVLLEKIKHAQLTGQRVNLEYEEKYYVFPWRGGTKYIAVDIELGEYEKPNKEEKDFPLKEEH